MQCSRTLSQWLLLEYVANFGAQQCSAGRSIESLCACLKRECGVELTPPVSPKGVHSLIKKEMGGATKLGPHVMVYTSPELSKNGSFVKHFWPLTTI